MTATWMDDMGDVDGCTVYKVSFPTIDILHPIFFLFMQLGI